MIKFVVKYVQEKSTTVTLGEICKEQTVMLDFSNFDGLTPNEVLGICPQMQAKNVVVFVVYNAMTIKMSNEITEDFVSIIDHIPIIINDTNRDVAIDELIVDYYLSNYNELSCRGKKQARCFLQRYKYETKERTDEILKEKVYKKEDNK